jgi:hypothetical protein
MNDTEKFHTIQAMRNYGGSFVQALAMAWERADSDNSLRIQKAFPEYMAEYGPGSAFYRTVRDGIGQSGATHA